MPDAVEKPGQLGAGRAARAGGLLVGIAIADGWRVTTELALCVADAALSGRALTDDAALGLLERNLRALAWERGKTELRLPPGDPTLAVAAVVALAGSRSSAALRAAATSAVLRTIDAHAVVDEVVRRWVEEIAAGVDGEAFDPGEATAATSPHAADAERARSALRSSPDPAEVREAGPATGALVGLHRGMATEDGVGGWPGVDLRGVAHIGAELARLLPPSEDRPVARIPVGGTDGAIPPSGAAASSSTRPWRVSRVTLPAVDIDDEDLVG
jgi:hypothetical protein